MDSLETGDHGRRGSEAVYDTRYQKSLRHYLSREALPNESHYRNLQSIVQGSDTERPTLDYLYQASIRQHQAEPEAEDGAPPEEEKKLRGKVVKFGWMIGVLMPCLLNIWGVMLFLRLSWVVGEAGIVFGVILVCLANFITFVTTLSMSAVATNGQIKGGGIYYMISRSLGPEFGGSIGLVFTLANSIAAATYIIGFVNSIQDMCRDYFSLYEIIPGAGGGTNDVRILGTITLFLVLIPAIVGMDWVARVQKFLLVTLIISQINFIVGAFMGPQTDLEKAQGFVGFNGEVFYENLKPEYRFYEGEHGFFSVFGVFFPAVTGIVAGANLSGDLKNPGTAIPKGTLAAVGITYLTYVLYPVMVGGAVVRHATGNVSQYLEYELTEGVFANPAYNISTCGMYETGQGMCKYGSQNNFQIIELMSAWGPLIYIGCFAATLSSAIASLVGAPRVLQALSKDKLYPYIHVFGVGFGANNDPFRGYILVCVISFACILLGELNAVSSLLTNCFLASYALINISCFHATFAHSPGWRPAFKFFNQWLSLVGGFLCVIVMFLIDWVTALITVIVIIFLYKFVVYRKPDVNWGSSAQAQIYNSALKSSLELTLVEEHVKNFRPQFLVLSGSPWTRPTLVDFVNNFTKNLSLLTCANIVKGPIGINDRSINYKNAYTWFDKHKIGAFYNVMEARDLEDGSRSLLQAVGLGKLRPNIMFAGYKTNWRECDRAELRSYFHTLHDALTLHYGLAILRVQRGFDFSSIIMDEFAPPPPMPNGAELSNGDLTKIEEPTDLEEEAPEEIENKKAEKKKKPPLYIGADGQELSKQIINDLTIFQQKQKGKIDVWWLYDDGGLTLLLPYILTTQNQWSTCKMRVFALANRKDELELEQRSMANLLAKFRIDYSDMIIIPDMAKKASRSLKIEFEEIVKEFKTVQSDEDKDLLINETDLKRSTEKTNRHLRLRELLQENSRDASLIVMTLPIPRKNAVSASLYMAWLEILTMNMPPFLLVRGNQASVLTYYS